MRSRANSGGPDTALQPRASFATGTTGRWGSGLNLMLFEEINVTSVIIRYDATVSSFFLPLPLCASSTERTNTSLLSVSLLIFSRFRRLCKNLSPSNLSVYRENSSKLSSRLAVFFFFEALVPVIRAPFRQRRCAERRTCCPGRSAITRHCLQRQTVPRQRNKRVIIEDPFALSLRPSFASRHPLNRHETHTRTLLFPYRCLIFRCFN